MKMGILDFGSISGSQTVTVVGVEMAGNGIEVDHSALTGRTTSFGYNIVGLGNIATVHNSASGVATTSIEFSIEVEAVDYPGS
jgi:tryptophan synthase beta subunit